jgi:hypothetical protein
VIDACFAQLEPLVGTAAACGGSGKSRATHYRRCQPPALGPRCSRSTPSNALTAQETAELFALLRSPRFVDLAPAQVWAITLDEGLYLASISTMYRVLRASNEVRERRAQAKHPPRVRPELMAERPNMCWSWDITKLRGDGPIFVTRDGTRLDRHGAGRIVRRVARRAGITKQIGPHTLRHAFITAALDAGVPLRDVQEAASHADPRTTMRYDRARVSLDRHATYIVAAFIAGAAR